MNACSCLTLILACIVYWQAREISRLAAAPDFLSDPDLLRHVSPIAGCGWVQLATLYRSLSLACITTHCCPTRAI